MTTSGIEAPALDGLELAADARVEADEQKPPGAIVGLAQWQLAAVGSIGPTRGRALDWLRAELQRSHALDAVAA